jgi:hypothetical protein
MHERKLPKSWVDKIFFRLKEIYGSAWIDGVGDAYSINHHQWSTALASLSPDQIKNALEYCRQNKDCGAPTHIQFHFYANKPREIIKSAPEIAKKHLDNINASLNFRKVNHASV